jgi:outer membrane protein assembly factor BamB
MRVRTSESPWPMFRHDSQHTGRSPYLGAQKAMLKWKYKTEGPVHFNSPVIGSDGTIYIGGGDYLYAVSQDGSLVWKCEIKELSCPSSPAIGLDGVVYVGSLEGYLYAIDPDGVLKWKYKTEGPVHFNSPVIGRARA